MSRVRRSKSYCNSQLKYESRIANKTASFTTHLSFTIANFKLRYDVKFHPREFAQRFMYPAEPEMELVYQCMRDIFAKGESSCE